MGIAEVISKGAVNSAVYWGNPVDDGYGGKTFDPPIDIDCRWEDMKQVVADAKGNEITCRAVVYSLIDLVEEGMLYRGTLAELNETQEEVEEDPTAVEGAFIIKRFQKTPAFGSTTIFLRKAFLTPSLSFGGF